MTFRMMRSRVKADENIWHLVALASTQIWRVTVLIFFPSFPFYPISKDPCKMLPSRWHLGLTWEPLCTPRGGREDQGWHWMLWPARVNGDSHFVHGNQKLGHSWASEASWWVESLVAEHRHPSKSQNTRRIPDRKQMQKQSERVMVQEEAWERKTCQRWSSLGLLLQGQAVRLKGMELGSARPGLILRRMFGTISR